MIRNLFKLWSARRRARPDPSGVISFDDAARELDIEVSARSDAAQGIPGPNGDRTETELKIQNALKTEAARMHEKVHSVHDHHHRRSLNLEGELTETLTRFKSQVTALSEELENKTDENRPAIIEARRRFIQADSALRAFQSENRLNRTAQEEHTNIHNAGLLMMLIFAEAVLNAAMFAQGSDQGLLGGVIVALIASFANVGQGVLHGLVVRLVTHVRLWRRLLGLLALTSFLGVTLMVNHVIANYRSVSVQASSTQDMAQRLVDLFTTIHWLGDFHSALLFALGVVFAVGGLYKGYYWTDPYWGYGERAYRRDELADAFEEEKVDSQESLSELSLRLRNGWEDFRASVDKAVKGYRNAVVECEAARRHYAAGLDDLESKGDSLFDLYRCINLRSRPEGEPLPEWPERTWRVADNLKDVRSLDPLSEEAIQRLCEQALAEGAATEQAWAVRLERCRRQLAEAARSAPVESPVVARSGEIGGGPRPELRGVSSLGQA